MSDKELNELVEKYHRYQEFGEKMEFIDFHNLFEELLRRYDTQHQHANSQEIRHN